TSARCRRCSGGHSGSSCSRGCQHLQYVACSKLQSRVRETADQPCRCFSRGFFLLMTKRLPLRITIWQSFVSRLMLLRTFMGFLSSVSERWPRSQSLPIGDSALGHVVGA